MSEKKIALIGLGYVGLPLAVEFGKNRTVVGFDISQARIDELKNGLDSTLEITSQELVDAANLTYTYKIKDIKDCQIYIVTVPTPIDKNNHPDLEPLKSASEMLSDILKIGDIVIYESTVYPGATEEVCVPILEEGSKLKFNKDFYCGYSPERINPGDKEHRVTNIKKVTSGSTKEIATVVDDLYKEIIIAGTHKASSIRIAEASKVIENIQRDVNIAIINEIAIILNQLDIDTESVLKAAGSKWNFLNFKPGLVGGHCIGIDPYYLKHKAQSIGYYPEIISSVRKLNDSMGHYVVGRLVEALEGKGVSISGSRVLIMGFTFKENCPDLRNTKIIDIVNSLRVHNARVDIHDPWVSQDEVKAEYDLEMISSPKVGYYDAIIIAVAHDEFKSMDVSLIRSFGVGTVVIYDLKHVLSSEESDLRL